MICSTHKPTNNLYLLVCWCLIGLVLLLVVLPFGKATSNPAHPDFQLYCNITGHFGGACNPTAVFVSPTLHRLFLLIFNLVYRFDTPVDASFPADPPPPTVTFGSPAVNFNGPRALWVDHSGTLWVSDSGNNRVLWWDNAETQTVSGLPPNGALGQSSISSISAGGGQAGLNYTWGIYRDDTGGQNLLWVCDTQNYRVVGYDFAKTPKANGIDASYLLGQPTWSSAIQAPPSPTSLGGPVAVYGDGKGGLFVADNVYNRVLFFPNSTDQGPASVAFGQSNLTAQNSVPPDAQISIPSGVWVTSEGDLFVADKGDMRILLFYGGGKSPTQSGLAANVAFGRPNLTEVDFSSGIYMALNSMFYDDNLGSLWAVDACATVVIRWTSVIEAVDPLAGLFALVSFPYQNLNAVLTLLNSPFGCYVQPVSLTEKNAAGAQVGNPTPFPSAGFNITSSINPLGTQTFVFTLYNPALEVTYSLFKESQTLSSAGVTFDVANSSLKLSIDIEGWNFAAPTNTLDFLISLNITPPVTSYTSVALSPAITLYTFYSSNVLVTTLQMLSAAVVDGVNRNVTFSVNQSAGGLFDILVHFPHFTSSLVYDPDFGVTLGSNGGSSSGDGGASNLLPLLALLALLIPIVMVAVVVVVVVVVWIVRKQRMKKYGAGSGNVNY